MRPDYIFYRLLEMQRKDIRADRLSYKDVMRLTRFINEDFFYDNCCLYNSKITTNHISFYYSKKKVLVKRIVYNNFKGDLFNNEYVKSICKEVKCVNPSHLYKTLFKNDYHPHNMINATIVKYVD